VYVNASPLSNTLPAVLNKVKEERKEKKEKERRRGRGGREGVDMSKHLCLGGYWKSSRA
jgi:hypothetical protein